MQKSTLKHWYWTITGTLIGVGFLAMLTIGLPFLLVGLGMLIGGLLFWRARGFWIFLLIVGAVPALILLWDIVTAPPPCAPNGSVRVPPGPVGYACGGHLEGYYLLAAIFGAIALLGASWRLLQWLRTQKARKSNSSRAEETTLTKSTYEVPVRLIEGIIGVAAGLVGLLMLGLVVFGSNYPAFASQQCTSGSTGTICTPLKPPVNLLQWGISPLTGLALSVLLIAALSLAISAVLHAALGTTLWQRALQMAVVALIASTLLSMVSLGLPSVSLLTSTALAVVTIIASYTNNTHGSGDTSLLKTP